MKCNKEDSGKWCDSTCQVLLGVLPETLLRSIACFKTQVERVDAGNSIRNSIIFPKKDKPGSEQEKFIHSGKTGARL